MSYKSESQAILNDPCSSFWLRNALAQLETRDALDAERDATLLARVMRARVDEAIGMGEAHE